MIVDFPTKFRAGIGSSFEQELGVVSDFSDDGGRYARILRPKVEYSFNIRWGGLQREEYIELVEFIADNRGLTFRMEIDGTKFLIYPDGNIQTTWAHGSSMVDCNMRFRGVKDE